MFTLRPISFLLAIILAVGLLGCSESTSPDNPGGNLGGNSLEGNVDPGTGTFVLKTLDVPTPEGPRARVQLIGSDLVSDPETDTVSLMVSLHSLHPEPLLAPATVWIGQLQPAGVEVLNPDFVRDPFEPEDGSLSLAMYGFDYTDLLGDDGMLGPEETSAAKQWQFMSPDLAPFAFGARAEFGPIHDLPRIAGLCWHDNNRNGIPEPDEQHLPHGVVVMHTPGGEVIDTFVGQNGRYSLPIEEAGLFEVFYDPMIDTFAPIAFSTPNPRQVVITLGPDGQPQSFLDANFGLYTDLEPGPPLIQFTDLPPDSLHYELWKLIEASILQDHILRLEVGFSGCQPEHPFSLWMTGGFMESMPVQVNLVPVHELAEDCDAYFTGVKDFNLWPLRENFLRAYGPGVLLLNVIDFNGEAHQIEWGIYPPD